MIKQWKTPRKIAIFHFLQDFCSTGSKNDKKMIIKGPDNPTSQLLPIMSIKGCSRDGERERRRWRIEKLKQLCVTKWNVKDGVWRRKMVSVCDKAVCERWCVCVWKLCVKESVWQSCVWKMVCDKVVCERWCGERWCVTKLCAKDGVVKDGVWQSYVWKMVWWKMVCDKVVCEGWCGERWCVTKWCVKDGVVKDGVGESSVWKRVCDKVVCERRCVCVCERWCVKDGVWQSCVKNGVGKMVRMTASLNANDQSNLTGLTSCSCGCSGVVCDKVVCDKVVCDKVVCDRVVCERWCVTKLCVKDGMRQSFVKDGVWQSCVWKMVCEIVPRLPRETTKPSQALDTVPWMPRLPRKTKVDVRLSHACHAKRRWMWDCAMPATQNEGGRRWMWDCATPATQSPAASRASRATKPVQARHRVPWVPRLPRETMVDVKLCHACHMKRRWMWGCATPATQSATWQSCMWPSCVWSDCVGQSCVWSFSVWKMVCVTKLCVKDGVCQSCVWKMVRDKVVCERWWLTK